MKQEKRLYTTKIIAGLLNITPRRVSQLVDMEVLPVVNKEQGLFELLPTIHAYIDYIKKGDNGELNYNDERAKLVKAKREREEIEIGIITQKLFEEEKIKEKVTGMLVNFKSKLLSIPSKITPIIAEKKETSEIFDILKNEIYETLEELSTYDKLFKNEQEKVEEYG